MKKVLPIITLLSIGVMLQAQTFVSTEPSNKNIVLEEFTGVECVFCPAGHATANSLANKYPGRVCVINIHSGHYADTEPDFRTEFGAAITDQTGLQGYPSGTINRHVFSGANTAVDYYDWAKTTAQMLEEGSYVNVAAISHLDLKTRKLDITVELYYTGNSPVSTNKLNVALLQSNILGRQLGMDYNPAQIVGEQYNHTHMLRHLLTGQWGEDITDTKAGSFVSKTYSYNVPEHYYDIPVNLEDLEVIVFLAEGTQEIITGTRSVLNIEYIQPKMTALKEIETYACDAEVQLMTTINNRMYDRKITSMTFEYDIDGNTETYEWTGSIDEWETPTIPLPLIPIVSGQTHAIEVRLVKFNGEAIDNIIPYNITTSKTLTAGKEEFSILFVADRYGAQNSFKFFNASGEQVFKGGPLTNLNYDGTTQRRFTFTPEKGGCYKLEVYDKGGDGINCGHGEGYFTITDVDGTEVIHNDGKFGSQVDYYIKVEKEGDDPDDPEAIQDESIGKLRLYPNPASDVLHIETEADIRQVEIVDLGGRLMTASINKGNNIAIDGLSSGIYIIKVYTDEGTAVRKFVKK